MEDDNYQPMPDRDFDYNEEDPRVTRVLYPATAATGMHDKDAALTVDEIAHGLENLSMPEDSSSDEDDHLNDCVTKPIAVQKEDREGQSEKKSKAKNEKKGIVAVVKPSNRKNFDQKASDKIKEKKSRTHKEKKSASDEGEECPSTSGKHTSRTPDIASGYNSGSNQNKALSSPELQPAIGADDKVSFTSDEYYESDNDQARNVNERKLDPVEAQNIPKGTAKTKMAKTGKVRKDQGNMEDKQEQNNKKKRTGKIATAMVLPNNIEPTEKQETVRKIATAIVVPNNIEPTEEQETVVNVNEKMKRLRKLAKAEFEPETLQTQDLPAEVNKIKNKEPVEKIVPNNSKGSKMTKGKQEEQINEKVKHDETSCDSEISHKPSRSRKLANPDGHSNEKENKTIVKKTVKSKQELQRNDMEPRELSADDNLFQTDLPAKGRQRNLRKKENELKGSKALKESNTAQEVKPATKKKNVKKGIEGDLHSETNATTNISEAKPAPKRRNMKITPEVDAETNLEENINVPRSKDVQSDPKEKEVKSKARKGAKREQENAEPKETAPRMMTRNRK